MNMKKSTIEIIADEEKNIFQRYSNLMKKFVNIYVSAINKNSQFIEKLN